jgi:hypothetical protein
LRDQRREGLGPLSIAFRSEAPETQRVGAICPDNPTESEPRPLGTAPAAHMTGGTAETTNGGGGHRGLLEDAPSLPTSVTSEVIRPTFAT